MQEADPTFWEWLTGGLASALGGFSIWVMNTVHGTVKEKADAADVVKLAAELKAKADEKMVASVVDRLDTIISNSREDTKVIFQKIDDSNKTHSEFAQMCIKELGARPTRDEWRETCPIQPNGRER